MTWPDLSFQRYTPGSVGTLFSSSLMRSSLARWLVSARAAWGVVLARGTFERWPAATFPFEALVVAEAPRIERGVARQALDAARIGHAERGVRRSRPVARRGSVVGCGSVSGRRSPVECEKPFVERALALSGFVEIVHAASIANRTSVPLSARSLHAVCRRETDRGRRFAERTADESGRERHGIPYRQSDAATCHAHEWMLHMETSSAVLLLHGDVAGVDGYAVGSVNREDRLRHVHVRCGPCRRSAFVHRARKARVGTVRRRGAQDVPERLS